MIDAGHEREIVRPSGLGHWPETRGRGRRGHPAAVNVREQCLKPVDEQSEDCLLYTSDAADE